MKDLIRGFIQPHLLRSTIPEWGAASNEGEATKLQPYGVEGISGLPPPESNSCSGPLNPKFAQGGEEGCRVLSLWPHPEVEADFFKFGSRF